MKYGMDNLKALTLTAAVTACVLTCVSPANAAGPTQDQATRMYNRIAGIPPTAAQVTSMTSAADAVSAALIATQDPSFYNNTIRNMATPWTNVSQTVFAPLNDYTATVVGMVRDDVPFNTLLSADLVYTADAAAGVPAYSAGNNAMYVQMDAKNIDLKAHLVAATQSSLQGIPTTAVAGVLTTRGSAAAFFINGTNRRMFRFTMLNHLCNDLQMVMDTTRPPDRIRQDVTRSPGGVSTLFLNNCVGCHSGMDPMAQAFAFYDFTGTTDPTMTDTVGTIAYTAGQVVPKYHINNTNFPQGFSTMDDAWENRWTSGPNMVLGWSASVPHSGNGAKSLGTDLENSTAFASCQVTRVFKQVCLRAPDSPQDITAVSQMITSFQSGYVLRQVFAQSAAYCMTGLNGT
jgi:hypothetical protein